jgi:hypothetical protein
MGQRPVGPVANVSIQIRYCTATTADKPFWEMQSFIGRPGWRTLADGKFPAITLRSGHNVYGVAGASAAASS